MINWDDMLPSSGKWDFVEKQHKIVLTGWVCEQSNKSLKLQLTPFMLYTCMISITESSISSEDQPATEQNIVSQVLYANRENVNMVHEVFRQVRLLFLRQFDMDISAFVIFYIYHLDLSFW